MADDWIREQARRDREADDQRRKSAEEARRREADRQEIFDQQMPQLWSQLVMAVTEKAETYNRVYGEQVLLVESLPDKFTLRGERNAKIVILECGAKHGSFTSRLRFREGSSSGESSGPGPFLTGLDTGQLAFGWAGTAGSISPEDAAIGIVRVVLEELNPGR